MAHEEKEILDDIGEILLLFSKGAKVLGSKEKFKEAVSRLIVCNEVTLKNYESVIDFILDSVVIEWREHNIKKEDLIIPHKRGETYVAKKMAIILVKQQIDITNEDLAKYFGTNTRQRIQDIFKEYRSMNNKYKQHAIFLEKHERLQIKIHKFIKDLPTSSLPK